MSPELVVGRRRNDQLLIEALNRSSCPIQVTAHRNVADARRGKRALPAGGEALPAAYRAVYDFDTLAGPGRRHRPTTIVIDPLANGEYPASEPVAHVIGSAPWTPHFANGVPVCHGHGLWVPNRTQLVDYVIHLGRLLNFDEPPPDRGYTGYNAHAIAWWREHLHYGPLDPGLQFPIIQPADVLAGRPRSRLARVNPAKTQAARFQGRGRTSGSRLRPVAK